MLSYQRKLVVSGDIAELYVYEEPVFRGLSSRAGKRSKCTDKQQKMLHRQQSAWRARRIVRRLVNANADELQKFVTLTFAENVTSVEQANACFEAFIKRLKRRYPGVKYIVVVEFQKRGAVHYHMLCSLPFVSKDELAQLWGYGFVKINRIDSIDNLGAYVCKYMTKDNIDERLSGRKCFWRSRNLREPVELLEDKKIEQALLELAPYKVYETTFESEHQGRITYVQFNKRRSLP